MNHLIIDMLAVLGGLLLTAGVFLNFGLGWALTVLGVFLISFALQSAKVSNVSGD